MMSFLMVMQLCVPLGSKWRKFMPDFGAKSALCGKPRIAIELRNTQFESIVVTFDRLSRMPRNLSFLAPKVQRSSVFGAKKVDCFFVVSHVAFWRQKHEY